MTGAPLPDVSTKITHIGQFDYLKRTREYKPAGSTDQNGETVQRLSKRIIVTFDKQSYLSSYAGLLSPQMIQVGSTSDLNAFTNRLIDASGPRPIIIVPMTPKP
jgi:hypothetical protein